MIAPPDESDPRTLIDELIAEQQALTAVERFARKHEQNAIPAQARYYRELIPLAKPQPGEQYAFGVDLDACTGCKACVSACHSLNGLDDDEIWRNIGLIHGGTGAAPYQQTVTTACHHCLEPGCLEGCPVLAYEKDPATGIVRHLDDQCIGCQYCVLKCPYDVPKYSVKRGIVRKCDMCHSRLAANEAPACVQACPSGAITIRIVNQAELRGATQPGDQLLPGAFDSDYTKPTTRYTSQRPIPADAQPGDAQMLRLEHAHGPLIGMLVLTQIAAGIFTAASVLLFIAGRSEPAAQGSLAVTAFMFLQLGLAVSVLHLGKPLKAWRAFLGWRTSWMSREILAFGAFAAVAGGSVLSSVWPLLRDKLPILAELDRFLPVTSFAAPLAHLTTALAFAAVYCSAMIYIDTRRIFWSGERTFPKFFGTALLMGATGGAAVLAWQSVLTGADLSAYVRGFACTALLFRTALFGWEFQSFHEALLDQSNAQHRSAQTLWQLSRPLLFNRAALFVSSTGFGLLGLLIASPLVAAAAATLAFFLTALAQFIERYCFFTAVIAPRMPGTPSPGHLPHS